MGCVSSSPPADNPFKNDKRKNSRRSSAEQMQWEGRVNSNELLGLKIIRTNSFDIQEQQTAVDDSRPTLGSIFGSSLAIDSSNVTVDIQRMSYRRMNIVCPDSQRNSNVGVCYGHYEDIGGRESMEDAAAQLIDLPQCAVFGVFDGHGGAMAAKYVSKSLPQRVLASYPFAGSDQEVTRSIVAACAAVDDEFLSDGVGDDSGTTAIFMIYHDRKLVVAGVGDSYAILSTAGVAELLSVEHKPTDPKENRRIESVNGKVVAGRIFGVLGVSRAFGDRDFKTSRGQFKKKFKGDMVICTPHVHQRELTVEDEFLILACDGLLDVMKPQQAVSYVQSKLESHGDVQRAAKELVLHATRRLNSSDNVTATIICFSQPPRPGPLASRKSVQE